MRLFLKKNRNQVIFQFGTQNFQCFGDVELHTFDGNAELFRYLFVRSILITAQYKNLPALVRHTFQCFLYDMLYFRIKDRIRFAGFQCRDSQVQFPLAMAIYLFFGPKTHLQMCQIVERFVFDDSQQQTVQIGIFFPLIPACALFFSGIPEFLHPFSQYLCGLLPVLPRQREQRLLPPGRAVL